MERNAILWATESMLNLSLLVFFSNIFVFSNWSELIYFIVVLINYEAVFLFDYCILFYCRLVDFISLKWYPLALFVITIGNIVIHYLKRLILFLIRGK